VDNYITSLELFNLKTENIHACGTVCLNRSELPQLAADKNLKRGEFDYRVSNQGISFFKWKVNRPVHFLSDYPGMTTVKCIQKDGAKISVPVASVVKDCNSHMGGVDKADMLRSCYNHNSK